MAGAEVLREARFEFLRARTHREPAATERLGDCLQVFRLQPEVEQGDLDLPGLCACHRPDVDMVAASFCFQQ